VQALDYATASKNALALLIFSFVVLSAVYGFFRRPAGLVR